MHPRLLVFALIFLGAGIPAFAQRILPLSFGECTGSGASAAASSGGAPALTPAILSEYGWKATEQASYECKDGPETASLLASLYVMNDPSGAYGLYSYLRSPEMVRADIMGHSAMSEQRLLALEGNLVAEVRGDHLPKFAADLRALAKTISGRARMGALPTLWQHLPARRLLPGTDRYILGPQTLDQLFPVPLGDSLGFSSGAEAELARYHLGAGEATLLLVDFPTPQIALQHLADLSKKFNVNGSNAGAGSPALFARRSVTLLAIVSGAPNQAAADALLNQVQSGEVLTWNEPTFSATQPSIFTIVVGTIVGTGIFCAFTLIASLAFGGARLLVKRALPGRVFDRSSQVQVLQLGLSSKPINAEDFYDRTGKSVEGTKVDKNLPDRIALKIFR